MKQLRLALAVAVGAQLALCTGESTPAAAQQDAPGGEILYSRKEGDRWLVHTMKADGSDSRPLPNQQGAFNINASWSPDGKRVLYRRVSNEDPAGVLYCVSDADGSNLKTFGGPGMVPGRICWSPDGKKIGLASLYEEGGIFILDVASGGHQKMQGPTGPCAAPFWRRDGSAIGYTRHSDEGKQNEIVSARVDGGGIELIARADRAILSSSNALSPDGGRLLFLEMGGPSRPIKIHLFELTDRVDSVIYDNPPLEYPVVPVSVEACWSPDGKWIVVSLPTSKGWGLFRMRPDGKMVTRLTPEGVDCAGASWRATP